MSAQHGQLGEQAQAEPGAEARQASLEAFIAELAGIAPDATKPISPESRLITDLGFDPLAFGQLAVLLFERYEVKGNATQARRSEEELTVADVFSSYVHAARAPRG